MNNKQIKKNAKQTLKKNLKISILVCLFYAIIINLTSLIKIPVLSYILSIALFVITPVLAYGLIISFMKLYQNKNIKVYDFLTLGFKNFKTAWVIIFRKLLKLLPRILLFFLICTVILFLSLFLTSKLMNLTDPSPSLITINNYIIIWSYLFLLCIMIVYFIIIYPKQLYYAFANYIMNDNNNSITAKEAVGKSEELMKNNRFKYFKFILSFIGWFFLLVIVSSFAAFIITFIITLTIRLLNSNIYINIKNISYYISYIITTILSSFIIAYIQTANVHFYEALKQENND